MSTAHPQEAVFAANTLAPRRRHPPRRIFTARCCLGGLVVLVSIIGIITVILVARFAVDAFHHITSPFGSFAHNPSRSNRQEDSSDIVRPLVDSSSLFDIRTTVWLDVSQHLKQKKRLPHDTRVVHYTHTSGEKRSEAILYSELLFSNVSMQSRHHSAARIRVPIEPLYSQDLGPSTLRATFQLVPRNISAELLFKTYDSIYPSHLPIGPRSPHSPLVRKRQSHASLADALDRSGISVNLVTLLATKWRLNGTQYNLRNDYGIESPMFDGSPSNRVFGKATKEGLYIADQNRIMIPHIKTRSRIILLKEDHSFATSTYNPKLTSAKQSLDKACAPMKNKSFHTSANGKCQRSSNDAVFENVLHFTNTTSREENLYYAPFLTQQVAACAQRHHRTLPRSTPSSNAPSEAHHDTADKCLVPMLQTDDSRQYFEFDLDVFFSCHHHLRSNAAEALVHTYEPKLQDYVENVTEIRTQMSTVSDMQWSLQGGLPE
jgi:hypothetical protein